MATHTPNYNLVKPSDSDLPDQSVLNGNMDKIDTAIKANATNIGLLPITSKSFYSVNPDVVVNIPTTSGTYILMVQDQRGTGRHALLFITNYNGSELYVNTIYKGAITVNQSGTTLQVSSNGYTEIRLWRLAA